MEIIKELYVNVVGWAWIAACIAMLYFLAMAIFDSGSWWYFLGSAVLVWLLYKVSLYYQLEKERALREPPKKGGDD